MTDQSKPGAFAPFAHPAFAVLWTATVLSNIGTWMMSTGSAWLMTSLSPSPMMIAAVQAASSAPVFLFALLAGALSDLFDKRRLLLLCQSLAAVGAAGFAAMVAFGKVDAVTLLVFTFLMASAAAFVAPAWQSIVPQLVPRPLLGQAIALNSMGINVARAIGPALAGLLIVAVGIAAPFAADAVSFLFIIAALQWWRARPPAASTLAREHVPSAIVGGIRYAANSPELKAAIIRAAGFFLFASAPMSLLPLVAQSGLQGDASTFGLLMAAIGAGAVAGALLLPRFKAAKPGTRLFAGTTLAAAGGAALGLATTLTLGLLAAALFGLGWIVVLATLNTAAQMALPDWVRARGLALFTMVFSGAMMAGSLIWGGVAQISGLPAALMIAAAGGIAVLPLLGRFALADGSVDLTPFAHWPEPVVASAVDQDRGPVLVTITYRIDPTDLAAMMTALAALEPARRRGGASYWAAFEDVAEPGRVMEVFLEASWAAHLRHHDHVSAADRALQDAVGAFHRGPERPQVTHWLAPEPGGTVAAHPSNAGLG